MDLRRVGRWANCTALGLLLTSNLMAAELFPVIQDPNAGGLAFGAVNIFADPPAYFVDDTALAGSNDIVVYTMDGIPTFNGAGLSVSVSNGENGIDSTEGGNNIDVPNIEPVNSVIANANSSGKLENGNYIRFSMWMRQDPANPVTAVPQIEPVLKIELWKEALSGNADFNPAMSSGFGDRVWDMDQNGGFFPNQSQASWVDMNNSGTTSFGKPVATSLVTDEWRIVETTLRVDDDPFEDGLGWSIGSEFFSIDSIEEIRGVMFFGDFVQTNLTDAGSIWVDNILMEFFPDEASFLATPNPNPMPIDTPALTCDFDGNMACDIADLDLMYDNLGSSTALFDLDASGIVDNDDVTEWLAGASASDGAGRTFVRGDANLDGSVGGGDFTTVASNFGAAGKWGVGNFVVDAVPGGGTVGGADFTALAGNFGFASVAAVPEPSSSWMLAILSLVGFLRLRRTSQA